MVRTRTSGPAAELAEASKPRTRGRKKKAAAVIELDGEEGLASPKKDIEREKGGPVRAETVPLVDSPISVLESEPQLTQEMLEEERQLQEERAAAGDDPGEVPQQAGTGPSSGRLLDKLDELLNKTKCFTKFLHERMDEVANEASPADDAKRRKRKRAPAKSQQPAEKRHVNTDYEEDVAEGEDDSLKNQQLQKEISPLVTGGTLKSYQLKGVKWMMSLYQNGLNGILADQMGLGKTVQTIAFLAHLSGNGVGGPFLIVAPLSTLSNWIREFKRWCPSLNSLLYHGTKADRAEKRRKYMPRHGKSLPMIVTSYEVVMADVSFLRNYKWTYVIVDEGHRLKNYDCKLFKELKRLHIENCLLLTGTPLQNNLPELWSLLHFILPDIFTSLSEFKAWFAVADRQNMKEEERDETRLEIIGKLHEILRPFLLRRMKSEVEKTLPKKKEVLLYAQMTEMQKTYHHNLIKRTLEQFLEENRLNPGTRKKQLNNICMQLRKNCNHPDLLRQEIDASYFFPPVDQLLGECGKLRLLDRLLGHLKTRGHRVLIFSQMTKLLDIIDYYMEQRGFDTFRIDGGVKQEERQAQIQKFEEGEGFAFLLSTRAGGLGINLTSADTAIIYDSDWNPQMDLQAMDRCHRIGQTKPVHVYRLLTAQSVECRMLKVANSKLHLETIVIDKGQFRQEGDNPKVTLSESDLMALLKDERTEEEELVQSAEISDVSLVRLLDRSDMEEGFTGAEFPMKGPGWEVSINKAGGQSLLSSVEGYRKVNT